MKHSPKIYAQTLVGTIDDKSDIKKIVRNFWYMLQKNNQIKELQNIIDAIPDAHAIKNNLIYAKVYSAEPLSIDTKNDIIKKLEIKFNQKIYLEEIIDSKLKAGIIVKVDDKIIDFSLTGKIKRLKQHLKE